MRAIALLIVLLTPMFAGVAPPSVQASDFIGKWRLANDTSAKIPTEIHLKADGTVSEHLGEYLGLGTWTFENDAARILWANGKEAILKRTADGAFQLSTWRQNTPRDKPPDFIQPATRIPR